MIAISTITISAISIFGFSQVVLICFGIFASVKQWNLSIKLFLTLLSIVGVIFARCAIVYSGLLLDYPHFIGWGLWVILLLPPVMYFFLKSTCFSEYRLPQNMWLHFLPAISGFVCTVLMFQVDPIVRKQMLIMSIENNSMLSLSDTYLFWVFRAERLLWGLQMAAYLCLAYRALGANIDVNPDRERSYRYLLLVNRVVKVLAIFAGARVVALFFDVFISPIPSMVLFVSGQAILVFIIAATMWYAVGHLTFNFQAKSSSANSVNDSDQHTIDDAGLGTCTISIIESSDVDTVDGTCDTKNDKLACQKYKKDKLSIDRIKEIEHQFRNVMENDQIYLDSDISLASVAQKIGCSSNHLSQALNSVTGSSFNQLISNARVDEAKRIFSEETNSSAIDVCFAVGFKSKSSFYNAFKKVTGITPAAYKTSRSQVRNSAA